MNLYTDFNNVEGAIWIVAALALPFLAKLSTTGKKLAVATSSLGFLAFGATDFLEASLTGVVPWWLWALKIVSGATILCGRFAYMGWKQFKFTDRYFLFGLFCLISVSAIMVIQLYFQCVVLQ